MTAQPTPFERITSSDVPGEVVAESEHSVAMRDLLRLAARVADQAGPVAPDQGWRPVFTSGPPG